MNHSSKEISAVSKVGGLKASAKQQLEALFSSKPNNSGDFITEARAKEILNEELARHNEATADNNQQSLEQREREMEIREREMCLKERQAGINTSKAVTGMIATWAVIGTTMLARSCINFDKGPKFRV